MGFSVQGVLSVSWRGGLGEAAESGAFCHVVAGFFSHSIVGAEKSLAV